MRTVAFACAGVVALSLLVLGCSGPGQEQSDAGSAAATIDWPAVSSVLEGTQVVDMRDVAILPFEASAVVGGYQMEQGGAIVSLSVRERDGAIYVERRYQEPEIDVEIRTYVLDAMSPEGAASVADGAYLRRSTDGVLLLEERSGVDAIDPETWIHYVRA